MDRRCARRDPGVPARDPSLGQYAACAGDGAMPSAAPHV